MELKYEIDALWAYRFYEGRKDYLKNMEKVGIDVWAV